MNTEQIKGNANQLKGKLKKQWAKLTDDDLLRIEGNIDELKGVLQKEYGYSLEKAKEESDHFRRELGKLAS